MDKPVRASLLSNPQISNLTHLIDSNSHVDLAVDAQKPRSLHNSHCFSWFYFFSVWFLFVLISFTIILSLRLLKHLNMWDRSQSIRCFLPISPFLLLLCALILCSTAKKEDKLIISIFLICGGKKFKCPFNKINYKMCNTSIQKFGESNIFLNLMLTKAAFIWYEYIQSSNNVKYYYNFK